MSIEFNAQCYAPDTAHSEHVLVTIDDSGFLQFVLNEHTVSADFNNIKISDRVGQTPRFLSLPQGFKLETSENKLIDTMLKQHNHQGRHSFWLVALENNLKWVVGFTLMITLSIVIGYRYGIPAFATAVSPLVPEKVRTLASEQALAKFDVWALEPSELDGQKIEHFQQLFESRLAPHLDKTVKLHFRFSETVGANAFALPDGTVVFTDQLLNLISDDEFLAIAAHEAGHVDEDHGMRSVISSMSLLMAVTLITGDSQAISELLITAPTLLMQLAYSRDQETQADDYAMVLMQKEAIPLSAFADGLTKIMDYHGVNDEDREWTNYLSSHPDTESRILKFRQTAL